MNKRINNHGNDLPPHPGSLVFDLINSGLCLGEEGAGETRRETSHFLCERLGWLSGWEAAFLHAQCDNPSPLCGVEAGGRQPWAGVRGEGVFKWGQWDIGRLGALSVP